MSGFTFHRPGEPTATVRPDDIILTHGTYWTGHLIRFGQRLRFRGARRRFATWNHAAVVWDHYTVVEALGHGVTKSPLTKYDDTEYVVIHTGGSNMDHRDHEQLARFVKSVLAAKARYGFLEILSLGLTLLIPLPVQFGSPGTMICSGLVASAMTRAGVVWRNSPEYMMPADIAEHYDVGGAV